MTVGWGGGSGGTQAGKRRTSLRMPGLCADPVWLMGPRSPEWFQVVMARGELSQDWPLKAKGRGWGMRRRALVRMPQEGSWGAWAVRGETLTTQGLFGS